MDPAKDSLEFFISFPRKGLKNGNGQRDRFVVLVKAESNLDSSILATRKRSNNGVAA
jgi:hypothetical protein